MARWNVDIDATFHRQLPYAPEVQVSGQLLFTAGVTARNDGAIVGPGELSRQFEQTFMPLPRRIRTS